MGHLHPQNIFRKGLRDHLSRTGSKCLQEFQDTVIRPADRVCLEESPIND